MLQIDHHPLLDLGWFVTEYPAPLAQLTSPGWLVDLLGPDAAVGLVPDDVLDAAVRALLRHGGFKPTGRNKPASEYLARAASEGRLGSINPAVDAGNAASRHGGLPISVVDLDRTVAPLRVACAEPDARYVFNRSGQEIDVGGLLCLHDAEGPCANAVKDAQHTKTDGATRRTLSLVWGTRAAPARTAEVVDWYRSLVERSGGAVVVGR